MNFDKTGYQLIPLQPSTSDDTNNTTDIITQLVKSNHACRQTTQLNMYSAVAQPEGAGGGPKAVAQIFLNVF